MDDFKPGGITVPSRLLAAYPHSTTTDLGNQVTPKSNKGKHGNINKYNPYSVNYQFNSCFQVQATR